MLEKWFGRMVAGCLVGGLMTGVVLAQAPSKDKVEMVQPNLAKYATVPLTCDLTDLSDAEKKMLPLLIRAGEQMDAIFWMESYGDRVKLLSSISDATAKQYAVINYGPWDRLDDFKPFIDGVGKRPAGATYYPSDMTKEEFEQACRDNPGEAEKLRSLYTVVRRNEGRLQTVPFHVAFAEPTMQAVRLLQESAQLAPQASLKKYLLSRAEALRTDKYFDSDIAWMEMKDNRLDIVIGPIETYEDQLFGFKATHECYVLVKDLDWSKRLSRYLTLLPQLQRDLPVEAKYKKEEPGLESDLYVYDVVYYAGDCNAGSKTIAINLPNDEQVQLKKGTRRLQLKNAMQAKFDKILVPVADAIIVPDQRKHITFDAFFANTMFHEVAHGLGIKFTVGKKERVREVLRDAYSALEEGKADVLGLYMVTQLIDSGELKDVDIMDYYVTFLAGIFRSVRFGAASAHGKANMVRFNYFQERGAFTRGVDGRYRVVPEKMKECVESLSRTILELQGNGNYEACQDFLTEYAAIKPELQSDLDRLGELGIPVDVVFEQGTKVLGL
jgi:Peptidase family M49